MHSVDEIITAVCNLNDQDYMEVMRVFSSVFFNMGSVDDDETKLDFQNLKC